VKESQPVEQFTHLNRPATIEWTEADDSRVCMALWDAGFCGPESAEGGPIMMEAKRIAMEAFYAGSGRSRQGVSDDK
jgi:hypothetical protein